MTEIKAVFAGKQTACQQVGDTAAVNQPRSLSTQGHTSAARCSVRPDDAARSTSLSPQKPEQRCVRRCRKENCTRWPRARTSTRTRTAGGCSRSGESYCRSSDNARKGWKTVVTNPSSWRTSTCSCLSNDRPHEQRAQSVRETTAPALGPFLPTDSKCNYKRLFFSAKDGLLEANSETRQ